MKKRILSIVLSVSLSLSCFCGDIRRIAASAKTEEMITESQSDDTENDSEIVSEGRASDSYETESDSGNTFQNKENKNEGDSSEKTDGSENNVDYSDSKNSDSGNTEENSAISEKGIGNSDDNDQTEVADNQNSEDDTDGVDSNTESETENTDDNNSDVQTEEFQIEPEANMSVPQTENESDYILPTQEKDGMYYNIDANWKLSISGKNIKKIDLDKDIRSNVKSVSISGIISDGSRLFANFSGAEEIVFNDVDTSNVTNMSYMFSYCESLKSLDLSKIDTSKVTNMHSMFLFCYSLKTLDISGFNTGSVSEMRSMFYHCESLETLDISSFDTRNARYMDSLFAGCKSLQTLDISNLNTSNAFMISCMFAGCNSLTELDVSGLDLSNADDLIGFFEDCSSLQSLDLSSFDTSNITDMSYMFHGCKSLQSLDLSGFDTTKVERCNNIFYSYYYSGFGGMFKDCEKLTSLNLSNFKTKNARSFREMFANCKSLTTLNISNFDFQDYDKKRAPNYLKDLFLGCDSLTEIWGPEILTGTPEIDLYNCFYIDDNSDGVMDYGTEPVTVLKSGPHHFIKVGEAVDALQMGARGVLEHTTEEGGQGFVTFSISEKEFTENESTTYNHEIARFACGLSTMAYSIKASTIKQCFKDLGYAYDGEIDEKSLSDGDLIYVKDVKGDKATYWIGKKNLYDGSVLVTVLIRGTDGLEWYDNFESGTDGIHHDGFYRGAQTVLDGLNKYFNKHPELKEQKVKLLVTGHSRGAAVANLVGLEVDSDTSGRFGFIENSDTFVYTFATPNVTCDDVRNRYDSRFLNIFNVVNPEDFVTKVMLHNWGYGRYGITLVLPSKSNTDAVKYNSYLGKMRADWKSYFASGYDKEYTPYKGGMKEVTDYVLGVNKSIKNVNDYYNKFQVGAYIIGAGVNASTLRQLYIETLATYMSGATLGKEAGLKNFILALDGKYGLLGIKTALYFIAHQAVKPEFGYGHQSESYMAAMNTVSREELIRQKTILEGVVNCPVDIKVTDESGAVIGEIVNNEITTEVDNSAVSLYVDGDSKTFMIPTEGNYHVTLAGNDEGVMDYSLCEYDCDTLMGSRIYYHNVPVCDGKAYEMEITGGADINSYELIDDAGSVVSKKQEISEEESNNLSVDVTVEGKGYADSVGNLTPGDYVTLYAVADEGNEFEGWYGEDGNLISKQAEYGFSIEKSRKFTAKFTVNGISGSEENKPSDDNTSGDTPVEGNNKQTADNNMDNSSANETAQNVENAAKELPPVGTKFTSAGKVYKISGDNTVTILKTEDKKDKRLTIPSSVVYEKHIYSVTAISSKAFKGLKKLESVSIPSSVASIGSKAFYNCKNLKKVTIKANKNLTVGKSAFMKVPNVCQIKVKGLKKKAKKKVVAKLKKQTNGTVN